MAHRLWIAGIVKDSRENLGEEGGGNVIRSSQPFNGSASMAVGFTEGQ